MKRLIFLVLVCLLVGSVQGDAFSAWVAYGDAYKTTNDTYTLVMWNGTGSHTWLATGNASRVEVLVVGAGAGGGKAWAGAGGAGGLIYNSSYPVSGTISLSVGNKGTGSINVNAKGNSGENSSFNTLTALGGGGGGSQFNGHGANGGSGGGGGAGSTICTMPIKL